MHQSIYVLGVLSMLTHAVSAQTLPSFGPNEADWSRNPRIAGTTGEVALQGCLAGSGYAKRPVKAGERISIQTKRGVAPCDSRGWTNGTGLAFYGPDGTTHFSDGMVAGPFTPLGMIIGAFSHREINNSLPWDIALQIFFNKSILIGGSKSGTYVVTSPIDGYLYLMMNDGNGYTDNDGNVFVYIPN